jgi:hypothetical protein
MYTEPKYFCAEEIFPPEVIVMHKKNGNIQNSIWRLMDGRIIWTIDQLREKYGTMIINDYLWNGVNKYRGYRPVISLIDWSKLANQIEKFPPMLKQGEFVINPAWSSFTSQHCMGRAIDCKFRLSTSEEVRQDIKKHSDDPAYKYIAAVEEGVSWLHFDTRSWDREKNGILFFAG